MKPQARHRDTGRFSYGAPWDRLCVCGRTLGVHTAEAPHTFDEDDGGPMCAGFKLAKSARPAAT